MQLYCPHCNSELESGYKFCPSCGKKINTNSQNDFDSHIVLEMNENKPKIKITTEFIDIDGSRATRSLMQDFQSLRGRIFHRIKKTAPESEPTLIPAINYYNLANYGMALNSFRKTIDKFPVLNDELMPHIDICKRVLKVNLNSYDTEYEQNLYKWNNTIRIFRLFKSAPIYKIRCKYCGHYTPYIHPDAGLAYFHTNNCQICGRGYPVPDFAWDGIDGQAYIYYRHSVLEKEFYQEFDNRYDVWPDHTHFLSKDK